MLDFTATSSGGTTTGGQFAIDNLTIGNAGAQQVPEPAGWPLGATALAALSLARCRRL